MTNEEMALALHKFRNPDLKACPMCDKDFYLRNGEYHMLYKGMPICDECDPEYFEKMLPHQRFSQRFINGKSCSEKSS